MDQTTLMILTLAVLVALSIGGVGYAFVSGRDEAAAKRLSSVTGAAKSAKGKKDGEADSASNRRKQVQETLKQLEERQREEKKKLLKLTSFYKKKNLAEEVYFLLRILFEKAKLKQ